MKISSASKKVLASALSAAMVVAFAPTVAFGATGDAVAVTIDADGGVATITSYPYAKEGTAITLGDASKDGYKLASWWYDADGDGKVADSGETFAAGASFTPEKSAVTLKAIYAMPTVDVTATTGSGVTAEIVAALDGTNVKKDATYTLTIANPNGTVVRTEEFKPATDGANKGYATLENVKVDFVANPLSTEKEQVRDSLLVSGKYTVALSDGTSTIVSKTVELVTVKTSDKLEGADAAMTTEVVYWLEEGKATATLPTLPTGQSWLDADGYAVGTSVTVTKDATFTATDTPNYIYDVYGYDVDYRSIDFAIEDSAAADEDTFAIEVKDPSGATVYTAELAGKDVKNDKFISFTFNAKDPTYQHALNGATEKAGTYSITVTKTAKDSGKVTTSKGKAVLTQVVYDAAEGSFNAKGALKDAAAQSYFVDGDATQTVVLPDADDVTPAEGYAFKEWTLNGKQYAPGTKVTIKAGEVNTIKATYSKEVVTKVAAPTVASASYDATKKQYTVKLATATAGAKIQYKINTADWADYTAAGVVFKATDVVQIQAIPVAGSSDPALTQPSAVAAISVNQSSFINMVEGASSYLEEYVGLSKVKYLEQDTIKAAIASGKAALNAQVANVEKDWNKLVTAQSKTVYDAVAAFANAELAKYENEALVIVGEKAYSIDAKTLATEQKAIKAITDAVAKAEANKETVDYAGSVQKIVTALNADLKGATESKTVTAADITAANVVTEALKAATTGEDAEKALAAYEALTDAQKALVATADVANAQKVATEAKAAAELAATQDKAAVNYVNSTKSKTVKLAKGAKATKKAATITYKSKVSASGAVVTYAKASGSSRITVKAAGTVTLKKATKKGTYKAKVTVTCGEQTRTVNVKFVVK